MIYIWAFFHCEILLYIYFYIAFYSKEITCSVNCTTKGEKNNFIAASGQIRERLHFAHGQNNEVIMVKRWRLTTSLVTVAARFFLWERSTFLLNWPEEIMILSIALSFGEVCILDRAMIVILSLLCTFPICRRERCTLFSTTSYYLYICP